MAAANLKPGFMATDPLYNLFECPVCLEKLADPYLLKCGHIFCKVCLEGIASHHRTGHVTCPTCRCETELGENGVSGLPKSFLVNQVQSHITGFIAESKENIEGNINMGNRAWCQLCSGKQHEAVFYCQKCIKYYCDVGKTKHKGLEHLDGHAPLPVKTGYFCKTHPGEQINLYCVTCDVGVCTLCFLDEHQEHKINDIYEHSKNSKKNLEKLARKLPLTTVPSSTIEHLQRGESELESAQRHLLEDVGKVRKELKELDEHLHEMEEEIRDTTTAGIERLRNLKIEVTNFNAAKEESVKSIKTLLERGPSAIEIIQKEKDMLDHHIRMFEYEANDFEYKVPIVKKTDSETILDIKDKIAAGGQVKYNSMRALRSRPIDQPMKVASINTGEITGLTVDSSQKKLLVCSKRPIVKSFRYDGMIDSEFSVYGEEDNGCSGIALDEKKCQYLVVVKNKIVRIDKEGYADRIKAYGTHLSAISYCNENNTYVVGNKEKNGILILDPISEICSRRIIVPVIGGFHVGEVRGVDDCVVAVSAPREHCVRLYTISGDIVKCYGSHGKGEGQLDSPTGVSTDPAGRLVVCDSGNKRLVSFWTKNGEDHSQVLLTEGDLGGVPSLVTVDHFNRMLAVYCENNVNVFEC